MLTSRPAGEPNVQGANMRVSFSEKKKPLGAPCIEYDLYFKRQTTEEWVIPADSTFDPPDWFQEGVDFVVWTEDRGTVQRPDHEWLWVEKASDYYRSMQTPFTRQLKKKIVIKQLDELKSNFDQLFELARKNLDDQ